MSRYVDRGTPLEGIERTARDSRIPYQFARSIKNFQLPDKRMLRRPGFLDHMRTGSATQYIKQALCKHTGSYLSAKAKEEAQFKNSIFSTPLSYALLRWHDDFQPKTTRDWTVEFNLRIGDTDEPLVANPYARKAKGTSPVAYDVTIREPGVYVYDQTILSNYHLFNLGTPGTPGTDVNFTRDNFDVFPLISLAIGFTSQDIFAEMGLVESSGANQGRYFHRGINLKWASGSPLVGWHHVAVVFDTAASTNGTVFLYVDGTQRDSFAIPSASLVFLGEYDQINGETIAQAFARPRDIILLNECTARAGYASSCSMTQTKHHNQVFFHAYDSGSADVPTSPWCLSPPRGTAMTDLRIWHEARSAGDINTNRVRQYPTGSITNLVGMWFMSNGGGFINLHEDSNPTDVLDKPITLHHTYPQYVSHDDFMHQKGVRFADGQHCILSLRDIDTKYIRDIAGFMQDTFGFNEDDLSAVSGSPLPGAIQGTHDWTVMMEIKTPHTFPVERELNDDPAKGTLNEFTSAGVFTRRSMATVAYALVDGGAPQWSEGGTPPTGSKIITDGTAPSSTNLQYHRAFDMTLFSIEGVAKETGSGETKVGSNDGERSRIPVARGLIDPEGHVVIEVYKDQGDTAFPYTTRPLLIRLRTDGILLPNQTYNLAFVQRVGHSVTGGLIDTDKFTLEIWVWDKSGAKPTGPVATRTFSGWTAAGGFWLSSSLNHKPDYDIIVGASRVNHGWDFAIAAPNNSVSSGQTTGPWRIPQHFMSPYLDQPGFFECSMFRLWAHSVTNDGIIDYMGRSISQTDFIPQLLVNLEFEEVSGYFVKNKSRYPVVFRLGYKSWGSPESYKNESDQAARRIKYELQPGGWQFEDCLGYRAVDVNEIDPNYVANNNETGKAPDFVQPSRINGLNSFQTTLTQRFGLVVTVDDSLVIDEQVSGDFKDAFIHNNGLLSEFITGSRWRGTSIGDRTILTSRGGVPKVFNGRNVSIAGFKPWSGGVPVVSGSTTGGSLTTDMWYGVAVVYFSEEYSIQHISPIVVTKLRSGTPNETSLRIENIVPHYDPRITSIRFYRTQAQSSADLAKSAPLLPVDSGIVSNAYRSSVTLTGGDASLLPAPLDVFQDPVPLCEFSASLNGRLWVAGDYLVPDALFPSDPGNPERFDTVANRIIIEEGLGDKITGLVAEFGALFVFKLNSLWRIDEIGGNQFQLTRVASVGASSPESIIRITLPDSGRSVIFFWSQHGPYLFDGSTVIYIGRPIEELDEPGESEVEYRWIDSSTVVAFYDLKRREIIVLHKQKQGSGLATRQRHTHAAVFNTLNNLWYFYTGVIGYSTMSQNFSGVDLGGSFPVAVPAFLSEVNSYKALVGTEDGKIYQWAASKLDGIPFGDEIDFVSIPNPYLVFSYTDVIGTDSATIVLLTGTWEPYEYAGTILTIRQVSSGKYQSYRVQWNDGANGRTFHVEKIDIESKSIFTPATNDEVYICQTPAEVEFPWDSLNVEEADIPTEKHIHELVTWHDKNFYFRFTIDFDTNEADFTAWKLLKDSNRKRSRNHLQNSRAEVLKLQLASFDLDSRFNAFGYMLSTTLGKQKSQ